MRNRFQLPLLSDKTLSCSICKMENRLTPKEKSLQQPCNECKDRREGFYLGY